VCVSVCVCVCCMCLCFDISLCLSLSVPLVTLCVCFDGFEKQKTSVFFSGLKYGGTDQNMAGLTH
jgi:hypothetical protein